MERFDVARRVDDPHAAWLLPGDPEVPRANALVKFYRLALEAIFARGLRAPRRPAG